MRRYRRGALFEGSSFLKAPSDKFTAEKVI
jgi:hypothetical protein